VREGEERGRGSSSDAAVPGLLERQDVLRVLSYATRQDLVTHEDLVAGGKV
jgi:hypothetical protein